MSKWKKNFYFIFFFFLLLFLRCSQTLGAKQKKKFFVNTMRWIVRRSRSAAILWSWNGGSRSATAQVDCLIFFLFFDDLKKIHLLFHFVDLQRFPPNSLHDLKLVGIIVLVCTLKYLLQTPPTNFSFPKKNNKFVHCRHYFLPKVRQFNSWIFYFIHFIILKKSDWSSSQIDRNSKSNHKIKINFSIYISWTLLLSKLLSFYRIFRNSIIITSQAPCTSDCENSNSRDIYCITSIKIWHLFVIYAS